MQDKSNKKESRPNIPSELKRRILVEAGHRCAIPTCRATQVQIAHINPWCKVKEHAYDNLIALCPNCHDRADRGEIDKKSLYMYKDNLRFFIDKYSKFELNILLDLANTAEGSKLFLSSLELLIKSILDDGLVAIKEIKWKNYFDYGCDFKAEPDCLYITEKGNGFVNEFKTSHMGYGKPLECYLDKKPNMIELLKEMFSEMVVKKNSDLIPKYYHPELKLHTNDKVINYQEFLESHIKYYASSIEYRVEYDEATWVTENDKLAARVFITTKHPGEEEKKIEVILIVQYKNNKIIRVWELTYPDWSQMSGFQTQ